MIINIYKEKNPVENDVLLFEVASSINIMCVCKMNTESVVVYLRVLFFIPAHLQMISYLIDLELFT